MCEVMNPDGRPTLERPRDHRRLTLTMYFWFGFEQEYFIMDVNTQQPLGFPWAATPACCL